MIAFAESQHWTLWTLSCTSSIRLVDLSSHNINPRSTLLLSSQLHPHLQKSVPLWVSVKTVYAFFYFSPHVTCYANLIVLYSTLKIFNDEIEISSIL
jgi:hypothetical protein